MCGLKFGCGFIRSPVLKQAMYNLYNPKNTEPQLVQGILGIPVHVISQKLQWEETQCITCKLALELQGL